MPIVNSVIVWPFIVLLIVWAIGWFYVKKTKETEHPISGTIYRILMAVGLVLIFFSFEVSFLNIQIIPHSPAAEYTGFIIEILGLLIAIWARVTLGRNWSANVTFKQKHELITKGPYNFVRHPIYTGMLTMALGAMIYLGILGGFVGIIFLFVGILFKLGMEEELMTKHFPKEYPKYKKNVKRLIPFIY